MSCNYQPFLWNWVSGFTQQGFRVQEHEKRLCLPLSQVPLALTQHVAGVQGFGRRSARRRFHRFSRGGTPLAVLDIKRSLHGLVDQLVRSDGQMLADDVVLQVCMDLQPI